MAESAIAIIPEMTDVRKPFSLSVPGLHNPHNRAGSKHEEIIPPTKRHTYTMFPENKGAISHAIRPQRIIDIFSERFVLILKKSKLKLAPAVKM